MMTMVEQLDERDRVAIVVYAGTEGVALPSTRLNAEGRAAVLKALEKLEAGGSTNGGAGPSPDVSADPSATPVAVESAWPTLVTAADGTEERTAIVMLKQLPAPARYDLTIDAGAGLTLIVSEVHLNADQKHPRINVTLQPSANPTPSTP
jgi:hypothetical protein